ncbi:DUF6630 family protein [Hymenobacter terricola]|uniref:DUF6630 family protein n=1 Tax=Hymenobacter terricola TaxID=2819236 RepID=UPI001B3113E7|nr:hypothetical protein [Hymenobacter terricola]
MQFFTLADAAAAQRITERLALVLRDPAAYQEQFAEELEERGIVSALPTQELRDLALIDALLSEDLLWESDYQEKANEIAEGLNEILQQQKRVQRLQPAALLSRREPGPEQLDAVQDALEVLGLALVLFTLDSDSYPLGVVAETQAENARQQARELGFGVTVY